MSVVAPEGIFLGIIGASDDELAGWIQDSGALGCVNFSALSLAERLRWLHQATEAQRRGTTVIAGATEPGMLAELVDEMWWTSEGELLARGAAREVIARHATAVFETMRRELPVSELHPSLKRGDGRARILSVAVEDARGELTALVTSGEDMAVAVCVQYEQAVENPVVGIMIRTRIGFEVYGTNTELEAVAVGPVMSGDVRTVRFRFHCALCPQSYTVTAASHDPNGVWHEWMEDAVAFAVADGRYTAGVANLRAQVTVD